MQLEPCVKKDIRSVPPIISCGYYYLNHHHWSITVWYSNTTSDVGLRIDRHRCSESYSLGRQTFWPKRMPSSQAVRVLPKMYLRWPQILMSCPRFLRNSRTAQEATRLKLRIHILKRSRPIFAESWTAVDFLSAEYRNLWTNLSSRHQPPPEGETDSLREADALKFGRMLTTQKRTLSLALLWANR